MKPIYLLNIGVLMTSACSMQPHNKLVLNEICGKDSPDNEWVEIYNNSDDSISLLGVYVLKIDEDGIDHVIHRFEDEKIPPHTVKAIQSTLNELSGHLSRKKELGIELVNREGQTIDAFYRDDEVGEKAHPVGGSYARIPNGTGRWHIVNKASLGAANTADTVAEEELEPDDNDSE